MIAGYREFQAEGRRLEFDLDGFERDPGRFLARLKRQETQRTAGRVPELTYWAMLGDTWVGRIGIRPELNEWFEKLGGHIGYEVRPSQRRRGFGTEMLRLALPEAKAAGLRRVLVTCDESNAGSRKIIEKNGGIADVPFRPESGPLKLRYWIAL
jgi:predicted acetyltransferase